MDEALIGIWNKCPKSMSPKKLELCVSSAVLEFNEWKF